MKKVILIFAVLVTISSCSFVKQVQTHCKMEVVSSDINTGSIKLCGQCDSLKQTILEQIKSIKFK